MHRTGVFLRAGRIRPKENLGIRSSPIPAPANRLLSSGDTSFEYDDNGNMTLRISPDATWTYTYDARNSLVEVKKDSETVATYVYDPDGNRIWAQYNDETNVVYHFARPAK